jgi:hypothetical protein
VPSESRWASQIGTTETRISSTATTLTTGAWLGRVRLVKIQIGRVWSPAPAVKVVTMISSKERAKASRPPASRAERRVGKVTRRKVWTPSAPRSMDASSNDRDMRRRRARVLLNTTTMQKVAWPATIVHRDRGTPRKRKADWRAMPVTIPGRAIGSTTSRDSVSRPKKRWRWTANESRVPRTRATRVAPAAAFTEVQRAARAPGLPQARPHQSAVKPSGGQAATRAGLKELITTTSRGT